MLRYVFGYPTSVGGVIYLIYLKQSKSIPKTKIGAGDRFLCELYLKCTIVNEAGNT